MKGTLSALLALASATGCCMLSREAKRVSKGQIERAGRALLTRDDHAWQLFFALNRQALPGRAGCPDPRFCDLQCYEDDRDVVWESWARASKDRVFASEVFPDKGAPVNWNELVRPQPRKSAGLTSDSKCALSAPIKGSSRADFHQEQGHEVRLNERAYTYIVNEQLYSRDRLKLLYQRSSGNPDVISFPMGSITVKADWIKRPNPKDKPRYHWRAFEGETFGLAALHIVAKDLPHWYWATFIHADVLKSVDRISDDNQRPEVAGTKWAQYKLVGTQVSFTDARGVSTLLGNRRIEGQPKTSCITCHAYARVTTEGGSVEVPDNPLGRPPPCHFWKNPDVPSGMRYLTTDFVWVLSGQ